MALTKAQKKAQKKAAKKERLSRHRPFKNFLWWFTGIICGIIFLFGGLFAGVMLIPIDKLTGGKDGVVSENLQDSTIGQVVFNLNKYGFSDLPILTEAVKGLEEGEAGKYIAIDYDKLNQIKFGSDKLSEEFMACIKIIATIENTIGTEALGDFGKLSIFTKWGEVEGAIDVEATNFNPKLYYYVSGDKYLRAFDDNGVRVAPAGEPLFLAALAKIPMLEAFDLIDERVGDVYVNELLTHLGGATLTDDSLIGNLLEGKRVNELGSITTDDVKVSQVLGNDATSDIAIVLEGATGKKYANITLGDLSATEFKLDEVKLSTFVNESEVGDLSKILEDIFHADQPGGKAFDELTIADLSELKFDHVHIATVLPKGIDNAMLVEILEDEFKKPYKDIMLTDLNDFDIDKLHLYKVLPDTDIDDNLKSIILDITGCDDYHDIFVSDLHSQPGVNVMEKIKLSTVLGSSGNSNPLLKALVEKDVSVGELAEAIDNLKICEVYGANAFKTVNGSAPAGAIRYNKEGVTYTYNANGSYYLDKSAGIWLLVGYTAGNYDEDGTPMTYTENSVTMGALQSGSNVVSSAFSNATVKQLIDCGIIVKADARLYAKKLSEVLNTLG